jgi:hypothetical protein
MADQTPAAQALAAVRATNPDGTPRWPTLAGLEWGDVENGVWGRAPNILMLELRRTTSRGDHPFHWSLIVVGIAAFALRDVSARFATPEAALEWLESRLSAVLSACRAVDPEWAALRARAEAAEKERDEAVARMREARCVCVQVNPAHLRAIEERDALRTALAELNAWTNEYGAHLCPTGADTYGEGVRDCKRQVAAILRAHTHKEKPE